MKIIASVYGYVAITVWNYFFYFGIFQYYGLWFFFVGSIALYIPYLFLDVVRDERNSNATDDSYSKEDTYLLYYLVFSILAMFIYGMIAVVLPTIINSL
tara:strand:+ start:308 stop:604 length:297 start_codon:yes stop_codon:yes gene_type:complete